MGKAPPVGHLPQLQLKNPKPFGLGTFLVSQHDAATIVGQHDAFAKLLGVVFGNFNLDVQSCLVVFRFLFNVGGRFIHCLTLLEVEQLFVGRLGILSWESVPFRVG